VSFNPVPAAGATGSCQRACSCGCVTRQRRNPSDLTDEEWAVLEPSLPVMLCGTPLGGRPEKHLRRTMVDALFYVLDTGCKWRSLPADFPPWKTVYSLFARWAADGGLAAAAVGYDRFKKVTGCKRHVLTDTGGLLVAVLVTPAGVQDRAGAALPRPPGPPGAPAWPASGPTRATPACGATGQPASSASPSRSSPSTPPSRASRTCPAAGSPSAPTPGSPAAGAAPAATSASPPTTPPGPASPPSSR
jgi:transposase